jgi:hypothetical protein
MMFESGLPQVYSALSIPFEGLTQLVMHVLSRAGNIEPFSGSLMTTGAYTLLVGFRDVPPQ